jgi:hypothetical protein
MNATARNDLLVVLDRLGHTLDLANLAARGREPKCAAEYLTDTLEDLGPELDRLRAVARHTHRAARRSPSRG